MKWRLLLAMSALVTMVLVAQDVPLAGYLRRVESERLRTGLERDAFLLGGAAENVLTGETDAETLANLQKSIKIYAARDGARVVVTDANGIVVASTDPRDAPGENFSNRPEIQLALALQRASGERRSDTEGSNIVYVAIPVLSGAKVAGVVRITFRASVIDQRADEKARGLLVVFGISLFGAVLAALVLASNITSPLRRLQHTTEHLAAGDFAERADTTTGPREVRSLAGSFNTMTERIAGLVAKQKAFAGDASHQLRTPLTALRLQLERAATIVDSDPEGARERIEAAGAETERLQRLVEGLLLIARSDGAALDTVEVDVSAMVRERAEVWSPFAEERGVRLRTAAEEGLWANAVPDALEQIIDNYVDNALGVCGEGTTITIGAVRNGDHISVHVIDEGPGMKPEHLAQAFDRFWRAPDAPHGGSGIGLAIVQHLAGLSGATVELRNRSDRSGLDASVELVTAP
jgi:signal transduction histidine kinase